MRRGGPEAGRTSGALAASGRPAAHTRGRSWEPAWHRRERASRSRDRTVARIAAARDRLAAHHSGQHRAMGSGGVADRCFECGAKPDRDALGIIERCRGEPDTYWTCRCGGWTYVNRRRAEKRGHDGQKPPTAQRPARRLVWADACDDEDDDDDGDDPDMDRRAGLVRTAGGRRGAAGRRDVAATGCGEDLDGGAAAMQQEPSAGGCVHEVGAACEPDAQKAEALLKHLADFPDDPEVCRLRGRYQAVLDDARRAETKPDSTLQLLRAQRTTSRRRRQCEAARAKIEDIDARLLALERERRDAEAAAERADRMLAEARGREEACRLSVAAGVEAARGGAGGADAAADVVAMVRGLQAQMEALPGAFNAGNLEAAHRAITSQLEALANAVDGDRDDERHASSDPYDDGGVDDDGGDRAEGVEDSAASTPVPRDPGTPQPQPRPSELRRRRDDESARALASGRRGTSPRTRRSRSRARDASAEAESRERGESAELRGAANAPGQRTLRAWISPAQGSGG